MALTDEQLEIISAAIQPLFQYLEAEVIADIARRIQKTLTYSRTAELQAMSMQKMGYSPAKIRKEAMRILNADSAYRKAVAKNTMEYKRDVRKLIQSITNKAYRANDEIVAGAGNMSWVNDLSVWKSAGKKLEDNSFLPQLVEAFSKQTAGELKNMTQTTGFKTMSGYEAVDNAYQRELDKAIIKICSGTFSQEKVLRDTVHSLAQSGLRSIDFDSGYSMQLDTASRGAIRTGCHQLSGKVTDKDIEQTGENLVYVSEHWGARNTGAGHANHEQWQGKVYFIKDGTDYSKEAKRINQDRITSLWLATGYSVNGEHQNDPLGLNGYNCRHNHHPWFEGASSIPKKSPEPQSVTINGKTYDYYAMTQKMRAMERAVRALKREKEALKALGNDTAEITARIGSKTAEYKQFCKDCGISAKPARLRYESGTSDLKKTKAWKDYEKSKDELKEYRVVGSSSIVGNVKDRAQIREYLSPLPPKATDAIDDITFSMNSKRGSGYMHSEKKIYVSPYATQKEVIHEVGHCLEATLFEEEKVTAFKRKIVQGLTVNDIIVKKATNSLGQKKKVYLLKSDRFVNAYQSRLYVDDISDALNGDGSINTDVMGEFISVAVEKYIMSPKSLKKWYPEMYKFIEEALL